LFEGKATEPIYRCSKLFGLGKFESRITLFSNTCKSERKKKKGYFVELLRTIWIVYGSFGMN